MEVLHDWDDDASRKILRGIRRAAPAHAQLLLIEALLPTESTPNWPTTLDMVMLTIGGRQRTLREYSDLARESGFAVTREIDTQSGVELNYRPGDCRAAPKRTTVTCQVFSQNKRSHQ